MSQMATRKSTLSDEKDKGSQSHSVDTKKKMAANIEKEKQIEKNSDKSIDKNAEKKTEKVTEKGTERKTDKAVEKKDLQQEKTKEDSKGEKSTKHEKPDEKQKKSESPKEKSKQNGKESKTVQNGVGDATNSQGKDALNGTVSESEDDDDDDNLIIDDQDDCFPELTYDDTSDTDPFDVPTPDSAPSRSFTRRSQVKMTRTPETPRPASDKQTDKEISGDDSKESKGSNVSKLPSAEAPVPSMERKLRSADSPKPQDKVQESPKSAQGSQTQDKETTPKKVHEKNEEAGKKDKPSADHMNGEKSNKIDVIDLDDIPDEPRKVDTNYSKSRVKVSPYRRSMRIADQTTSSVTANYTGNNTTMEMDITETSSLADEPSLESSPFLDGLRGIRGRRSYRPLHEIYLKRAAERPRPNLNVSVELPARPTGTVVGRKRRPDADDGLETAEGATDTVSGKRMRLLDRIAEPFRRISAPAPARRAAEIVGINTDLPLTTPVVATDPETLKCTVPLAQPPVVAHNERDGKRCSIM